MRTKQSSKYVDPLRRLGLGFITDRYIAVLLLRFSLLLDVRVSLVLSSLYGHTGDINFAPVLIYS